MTLVTSKQSDAVTELAAILAERSGLSGVLVFEEPQKAEMYTGEFIVCCINIDATQDWAGFGARSRDENFTIQGRLTTWSGGADESLIRSVRDRAYEIMAEIESAIRDTLAGTTLNSTVNWAHLVRTRYVPSADDANRASSIEFDIDCFARLNG